MIDFLLFEKKNKKKQSNRTLAKYMRKKNQEQNLFGNFHRQSGEEWSHVCRKQLKYLKVRVLVRSLSWRVY